MVLLHGFPLNRRMWESAGQSLAKEGFRVVRPDLRGHGESPAPEEASTMARCAEDVLALCDQLGIRRFVLGGFSLGGYVAFQIAATAPDRVVGLLLVDTRAEPDTEEARKARATTIDDITKNGVNVLADGMIPKFFTEATRQARPELVEQTRGTITGVNPQGAQNALRGMAERPDQRPLLSRLRVPTLIVVGSEDSLTPPSAAKEMSQKIAGAELVELSRAAHLSLLERPRAFEDAVVKWGRAQKAAWASLVAASGRTAARQ